MHTESSCQLPIFVLLYPDRPFRLGNLFGWEYGPETQRRERFLIVQTPDLSEKQVYAKERRLVEEVKAELARGRRCQIYAVHTQKRDVTRRLEDILTNEGIRVALLTTDVPPEAREGWYECLSRRCRRDSGSLELITAAHCSVNRCIRPWPSFLLNRCTIAPFSKPGKRKFRWPVSILFGL